MWLDIVIIGKNEENNLKKMKSSIEKMTRIINKTIYVDSNSRDKSVSIAKSFCDIVIELQENKNLCASLGRRVGATHTEKDWILFLDADMEITNEFYKWLSAFDDKTKAFGFVGKYKDIDEERKKIKYRVFESTNGIAKYFGGAVLLKRKVLFKSGNWASHIFSNEEIELYSRMMKNGFRIEIIKEVMVNHYTEIHTTKEVLMDVILMKNKKNLIGSSQVLIKAIKERFFSNLFYLQPLPYITFYVNILTVILIPLNYRVAFVWFVLSHVILILSKRNIKSVILAYFFQYLLIVGLLLQLTDFNNMKIKH